MVRRAVDFERRFKAKPSVRYYRPEWCPADDGSIRHPKLRLLLRERAGERVEGDGNGVL